MNKNHNKQIFFLVKRAYSFVNAGRGLLIFLRTTPNAWIQIIIFVLALYLGYTLEITHIEFLFILLASALVFVAETINTAVEIDINLTSPDHHPYARDTKDVAAGAVLIASLFALVVGITIFLPYFL